MATPPHRPVPLLRSPLANAIAAALVALGGLVGEGRAQGVVPQGAPRDMSRVSVKDTTIYPPIVAREFRGVWVSPAAGGDWPSRSGLPASQQKSELIALLDRAQAIGLNAIVFHVRLSGDALYATPLAPWSAKLTGRQGVAPGYDPLELVVREAHARGLQVHAWFNPFRASLDGGIRAAKNHVTRLHPSWVKRYGSQLWIDPGIPDARNAIIETIVDVVQRYDVDGVHLDDFFYPYRETRTSYHRVGRGRHRHTVRIVRELDFNDAVSWRKYGRRQRWTDRDDWRRHNIDDFVKSLYERVHEAKPYVAVGISPFGIWRPGAPPGITGLDSYTEIYADARKWLREGWVDYLAPQLYWPIDTPQDRFRALDAWWRQQNVLGRHVWPGLYTAGAVGTSPWAFDEIPRQISMLRLGRAGTLEANGHIHFRLGAIARGQLGNLLGSRLEADSYRMPALVPEMPWLGGAIPAAPAVSVTDAADAGGASTTILRIAPGDSTPVAWWLVQTRTSSGEWRLSVVSGAERELHLAGGPSVDLLDAIAVTPIDRVGQAGTRMVVRIIKPVAARTP